LSNLPYERTKNPPPKKPISPPVAIYIATRGDTAHEVHPTWWRYMSPPVAISSNIATGGDIGVLLGCKRASAEKSKSILTFPFLSLSFFLILFIFF